jgi:hypothetical protein
VRVDDRSIADFDSDSVTLREHAANVVMEF